MKKKQEIKLNEIDVLNRLDHLLSTNDLKLFLAVISEVNDGRVLLPWRDIKSRGEYYPIIAVRDGLTFSKAIQIKQNYWGGRFPKKDEFKLDFPNKSSKIRSLFSNYVSKHEQEIIANHDLIYTAGQQIKLYNLVFRSSSSRIL
jgi:hypothetical protein